MEKLNSTVLARLPLTNTAAVGAAAGRHTSGFRIGQLVSALVIQASPPGKVQLNIGGETFVANGGHGLKAGQTVALRVIEKTPIPVLKLLQGAQVDADAGIARQVRQRLPLQQPLTHLTSLLNHAVTPGSASQESSALAALRQRMLNIAPPLAELTSAAGVRNAMLNSGLFFEASLVRLLRREPQQANELDLKRALAEARKSAATASDSGVPNSVNQAARRIAGQHHFNSHSTPHAADRTSLLAALDGAIARLETLQLASHRAACDGTAAFCFELPVSIEERLDVIKLQFERRQNDDHDAEPNDRKHHVRVEIPLAEDTRLLAELSYYGSKLTVSLWSDNGQVRKQIGERCGALEQKLIGREFAAVQVQLRECVGPVDPVKTFSRLLEARA